MKKALVIILALVMILSVFAACDKAEETPDVTKAPEAEEVTEAPEETISGEITFIHQRTDLNDNLFVEYVEEFNKIYPDVKVNLETMTDYKGEIAIRMSTEEYGDVLMISDDVPMAELGDFFEPLGTVEELSEKYLYVNEKAYEEISYGIPAMCNANGIVYNKKVFTDAGVTEIPGTPEEFIAALQMIKDNTDAIPYYTNYADGWPLGGQWEAATPSVAGPQTTWANQDVVHDDSPWSEGKPYYVMSKLLFDMVSMGLTEEDPTTTNWEACKAMLGRGEIGAMLLGSWSISQMKDQAENPDDIGYMPIPYTNADGSVYANAGGDYKMGINVHSENKETAEAWLYWFMDESGYALGQGAISPVKGDPFPDTLAAFGELGVILVANEDAKEGEASFLDDIDSEAEIGRWSQDYRVRLVEAGIGNTDETFEDIMTDLNSRWAAARESLGID